MKKTRTLVFVGIFIAINVVLVRLLSVTTPVVRFDFGFLPIAMAAIMFGPVVGGVTGALADIIGMFLFPAGSYFPGFTLSGFISGAIYGLVLHNKPRSLVRTLLAAVLAVGIVDLGLNTVWLTMITGKAIVALLPIRLIKCAVMLPIEIILIQVIGKYLVEFLKPEHKQKNANI